MLQSYQTKAPSQLDVKNLQYNFFFFLTAVKAPSRLQLTDYILSSYFVTLDLTFLNRLLNPGLPGKIGLVSLYKASKQLVAVRETLIISPVFVVLISFNSFLFAFPPTCLSLCLHLLLLINFQSVLRQPGHGPYWCRCSSEQDIHAHSSGMSFFKTHNVAPESCILIAAKG